MPFGAKTPRIFRAVRTSGVADVLDSMGLQRRQEIDPAIRFAGIARTAEYQPIVCAGVVVNPGDLIIAGDDGAVVVPQPIADGAARRAQLTQAKDRTGRRAGNEQPGLRPEETARQATPPRRLPSAALRPAPAFARRDDTVAGQPQPAAL